MSVQRSNILREHVTVNSCLTFVQLNKYDQKKEVAGKTCVAVYAFLQTIITSMLKTNSIQQFCGNV